MSTGKIFDEQNNAYGRNDNANQCQNVIIDVVAQENDKCKTAEREEHN